MAGGTAGIFKSKKNAIVWLANGPRCFSHDTAQPLIERLLIIDTLDVVSLGLYVARRVAMILLLPVGAFQMAFMPLMMRVYTDKGAPQLFNLILKLYLMALSILVLLVSGLSRQIIELLAGPEYIASAAIIFPLALSIYFYALGGVIGLGSVISKKTHLRLLALLFSQFVTYSLIVILSLVFGLIGAAVAVTVGKFVMMVSYAIVGQKLHPLDWSYRSFSLMIVTTLLCGVYLNSYKLDDFSGLLVLLGIIFGLCFAGWLSLDVDDRSAITRAF